MANKSNNAHSHLTADERSIILTGIENDSSKSAIAQILGKNKSTIGKEIKLHRKCTYKCLMPLECSTYKKCKHGRNCFDSCADYVPFKCGRRDRSPGVCNGCKKFNHCRFTKFKYLPDLAHKEYRNTLVTSREGFNTTTSEVKELGNILKPLIDKGQSVYTILSNHPEITLSEKTIYTYIESGIFKDIGIDLGPMNLRRQVSRKIPRQRKTIYKKREDHTYLKGRTYDDYLNFIAQYPDISIVQMDTVYNNISNGPFLQTFKFVKYHVLIAIYHDAKTQEAMINGLNILEDLLGRDLFNQYVQILLTDRGSEFSAANSFEHRDEEERIRTRVFYCDPMASRQKGTLENDHIYLRYILPKECDWKALGLTSQDSANIVCSHVNSFARELLDGKSPLDYLQFMNNKLYQALINFGILHIDADKVTLKPYLLKNK